jgi:tight adherence protein B
MKAALRLGLAGLAAAALVGAASAATPLRIVEAGGSVYPQQSYILTLPYAKSLSASEVHVSENGMPVSGLSVAHQGTVNSQSVVVLLIDESLTMKGKPIANALAAARAFAQRANANRQIAVITFNGNVKVLQNFTSDPSVLDKALSQTPQLAYGTKNYDALAQAGQMIASAGVPSGSIIILTDGQSVGSVDKPATVLDDLAKAHVRVFSVGLYSPAFKPVPLQQMASSTGGRYVVASSPDQIGPVFGALGRQLSREYLLTYTSHVNPSTKVAVAVSVNGVPGTARSAYTTPALHIPPAAPYKPSTSGTVIQSKWTMLAVVLIFAGLIGYAISHALSPNGDALVQRVGDFVSVQQPGAVDTVQAQQQAALRGPTFLSRVSSSARRSGWSDRLAATLELADIDAEPVQVVLLTVVATVVLVLILGAIFGVFGIVIGALTPFVVRWWILRRVSRKRRAFAEQLPDNLDVLASALRAGHSLVSALNVVADDAPEPSKSEFRRVLAEEQFGVELEDALKVAIERMKNQDLEQVALVARLQREVGSNSAEVLDQVIDNVRAKMELRRLVRVLTAQGRLSRWVLTLLPIVLLVLMTLVGHNYMHPLFHETLGHALLIFAAIMVALGSWVIGKIVDIRI